MAHPWGKCIGKLIHGIDARAFDEDTSSPSPPSLLAVESQARESDFGEGLLYLLTDTSLFKLFLISPLFGSSHVIIN